MTGQKRNQSHWVLIQLLHSITRCRLPQTGGDVGPCGFLQLRQNLKLLTFGCFLLTTLSTSELHLSWDLRNTTVSTTWNLVFKGRRQNNNNKKKNKKQTTDHLVLSFYIRLDSPKENCKSINYSAL